MFTLIHVTRFLVSLPNTISVHLPASLVLLYLAKHRAVFGCEGFLPSASVPTFPAFQTSKHWLVVRQVQMNQPHLLGRQPVGWARLTVLGLLGGWVRAVCEVSLEAWLWEDKPVLWVHRGTLEAGVTQLSPSSQQMGEHTLTAEITYLRWY